MALALKGQRKVTEAVKYQKSRHLQLFVRPLKADISSLKWEPLLLTCLQNLSKMAQLMATFWHCSNCLAIKDYHTNNNNYFISWPFPAKVLLKSVKSIVYEVLTERLTPRLYDLSNSQNKAIEQVNKNFWLLWGQVLSQINYYLCLSGFDTFCAE